MRRWGIRSRVLFLALTPSVTILFALVGYFTYDRIAEVDVSLAQRGILVARGLAPGAEFALFAGNRLELQRLTDAALHEADVRSIAVADAEGQVLAHSGPLEAPAPGEAVIFTQPVMQTRLARMDLPERQDHAAEGAPAAPAKVGEITVEMSRSATRVQQQKFLFVGLAFGLACVLVAVVLALFIGNSVVHPIKRLASSMVELEKGHRIVVPATGGGELQTLNEGFNRMAAKLQADARELQIQIEDATRALVAQKDTAEQATKAKSRFIAAASHDLRQPLHAIDLFTSTLQRRAVATDLESVVRDLAQAVSVMDRLFDALLDISKLDAGTLRAEIRPFPLERLFVQLAAEYSNAAAQKHLRLHIRQTNAVVVSDELLVHRILANLVANAIRYTNEGTVMVHSRRRGNDCQIEVRDSGIGIPEDKQSEIFQEYYQIGNGARDRRMGLGLGLAIASRLARLLGTEVKVCSLPGRGSVFSLRLPRGERDAAPDHSDLASETVRSDAAVLPVLVVDDDPLVLASNRGLLEEMGCEVTAVADGESALSTLEARSGKPVLVLCDLWLSGGENGIDLLQRLSAMTVSPISGILISGDTRPETVAAARTAGFPLLHKPVSPAKLRAVVMQFAWRMREFTTPELRDEDSPG